MSWCVMNCSRPGCTEVASQCYILKDNKYNFHYPLFFCWDCYYFMQLDFSNRYKEITRSRIKLIGE